MRACSPAIFVMTCALVSMAASCGSDARGEPTPPTAVLLTTSDLGAGWTADTTVSRVPEPGLCGYDQARAFKRLEASAGVVLVSPVRTSTITELLFYGDGRSASLLLAEVREQRSACDHFSWIESRIPLTTTLTDISLPSYGDEMLAYREDVEGVPLQERAAINDVLIRVGGRVLVVSLNATSDDEAFFHALVDHAFAKFVGDS